jgi:4-hydroxy-2-oxoheptanedioate aldolase
VSSVERLRAKWHSAEPVFGAWCGLGSPLAAEILGRAGFDYVCLDLQHGLSGLEFAGSALQAISTAAAVPLVRVPGNEPWLIGRALDLGASGVVVPLVSSSEDAARAAWACRYPPAGTRSWGPVRVAEAAGTTASERNEHVLCIVMIETVEGVERLDEICRVPGVDAVYLGPRDLALSHGLEPGDELVALEGRIAARARELGIPPGLHTHSGEAARAAIGNGFAFATIASDRHLLAEAARDGLRAALDGEPAPRPILDADTLHA